MSVSKIDEEDYRDLRKKLIEILGIMERDPDTYLEVSLNALKASEYPQTYIEL